MPKEGKIIEQSLAFVIDEIAEDVNFFILKVRAQLYSGNDFDANFLPEFKRIGNSRNAIMVRDAND